MIAAFAAIIMSSCTHKYDNPSAGVDLSANETPQAIGTIHDYGTVNEDIRAMKTAFLSTGSLVVAGTETEVESSEHVEVSFYVNDDGFIPSGIYSYVSSDFKSAFTFDSGIAIGTAAPAEEISGGTISVSFSNGHYSFVFNCDLTSGKSLYGSCNGSMEYADVPEK